MTNRKTILGIILAAVGVFSLLIGVILGIWANAHSPNIDIWEALRNPDNYIIKQPYYTIVVLVAWGAGLLGAVLAMLGGILFITSVTTKPQRA